MCHDNWLESTTGGSHWKGLSIYKSGALMRIWNYWVSFAGLHRGHDARIWCCEETLFRAEGFYETAQFLIHWRFQGVCALRRTNVQSKQNISFEVKNEFHSYFILVFSMNLQGFPRILYNTYRFSNKTTGSNQTEESHPERIAIW